MKCSRVLILITALAVSCASALGATFTVINTDDTGVGSLRQAIMDSNASVGVLDTIAFNISGAGVQTITPVTPLPMITDPVTIDGYSQPGTSQNTLANGDNAVLLIELDGTNAGVDANGLTIPAGGSTVRGLVINRYSGDGIRLTTNGGGNTITGSFIGTNPAGTQAMSNDDGVVADGSSNNTIGGTTAAARNLISGNRDDGLDFRNGGNGNVVQGNLIGTNAAGMMDLGNSDEGMQVAPTGNTIGGTAAGARNVISGNDSNGIQLLDGSGSNLVQGNFIGTDITGTQLLGNSVDGVQVVASTNNTIGGTVTTAGAPPANIIAGNSFDGVSVGSGVTGQTINGNSIFGNGVLGINLGLDGVTLNDDGDADTGPNNLQNFPKITTVTAAGGNVTISGNLNSTPSTAFRLEFFANTMADASAFGEGQTFLGFANATTDATGNASYSATLPLTVPIGPITATATDPAGNTSEFSAAFGTQLLNISTRLNVLTGDSVLIGGFIITGSESKKVIVRGIGPSLGTANPPVAGALADPNLELHEADGTVVTNDNWKDTQEVEINATTIPPTNDLESAIVATLPPGAYTVIESGKNGGTGVGLVEVYDLDQSAGATLANISTRGFVNTGDNVMIGGFIIGPSDTGPANVLVRAIGPSLANANPPVPGALADPTLELHDSNGTLLASNDDWRTDQQSAIEATGIAPTNDNEAAIVATLAPGAYTAIESGVGDTSGVGLVEVYNLH